MKPSRTRRLSLIAAAVACCFMPDIALANPTGPKVVHGNASFNQQGKLLTVTNSPGSIINWQGFSIAAGETTRFVQQSTTSAVLNRVIGADPSAILGALQSNGRVWLINPNGIIFGNGAQIDTAGLVASTLNVMNADFLMGRMRFVDTPGAKGISNAGEIRTPDGGRVVLIAPQGVENSGIIHSPKGEVILAAGKAVEIADSLNPEVRIEIAAPEGRAINLGKIVAESGRIGIYGGIVANRGLVSADSAVVGENGKIVFRATRDVALEAGSVTTASGPKGGSIEVQSEGTTLVAGTVRATGNADTGGQVSVLGQNVGLIEQASVDVSGARGGGTALVGGDLRGENPAVRNAQFTFVGSGTSIKADATSEGNGGKVIMWADDTTRSHGSISARGGALGGDGGLVETSGKLNLSVTSGPDVRAPAGKNGTWLIDPNNIEIVPGQVFDPTTNTGAPFFAPLADGSQIGVDLINAQLDFGSNVAINTTSRSASVGADVGNITLSAPIVKSASTVAGGPVIGTTTLTFLAHNDIIVNPTGSITATGNALNVTLTANFDNVGGGALTLGGPIKTNGGSVNLNARDLVAVNAPIHTLNANGIGGGTVNAISSAGTVNLASTITSGSNVTAIGQTGVNVTGPVTGNLFGANSAAGPVVIASNVTVTGGMNITSFGFTAAPGALINTGSGGFTVTDTSPNTVHIQTGASVTSSGATIGSNGMQFDGTLNAGSGSVTLRPNTNGRAFFLGAEDATGVALTNAELARISTTGSLSIGNSNTGAITANGAVSFAGPSQVLITSGSTFTQNAGATITSSAPIFVTAPTGITLNAASSAPRFTFTANAFEPNQSVTSGSDIDIGTSTFGTAINLGVAAIGTGTLDMTRAQIDNLIAAGVVRIGTTSSGPLTIQGAIAPAGTSNLRLASGSSIAQAAGATITETNLALQVGNGSVNLPENNAVGTLAASLCCQGDAFTFTNAPGTALTIGNVDAVPGVTNFSSDASTVASFKVDALTVTNSVAFPNGTVVIQPVTSANKVDFGGADAAGVLGLSQSDLGNISAAKLLVKTNQADISAAIAPAVSTLQIAPVSTNTSVNFVAGPKTPSNLEFVQSDINNVSAGTLHIGDASGATGPLTVASALTVPNTIGTFVVQSSDTAATGVSINANLTAERNVQILADKLTFAANVVSNTGDVTVAASTINRGLNLGDPLTPNAARLLVTEGDVETRLQAVTGKLIFGSATTGDVDVNKPLNLRSTRAGGGVEVRSGGILTIAPTSTTGSLDVDAGIMLSANRMNINATVGSVLGDVGASRISSGGIQLGVNDTGSLLGLLDAELDLLVPAAGRVLRIGDSLNTSLISIGGPLTLPGVGTLSLVAGTGNISQTAGSTISVGSLAASANSSISLTQNNVINTAAAQSNFGNVDITRAAGASLTIGTVDGVIGVSALGGNINLRSDDLNITQRVDARRSGSVFLGNATLSANSTNQNLDIGGTSTGTPALSQTELNLIGADTLTLGDNNTGSVNVSAAVNIAGGVKNLSIQTSPSATTTVANALTVPGSITVNTGTLNVTAPLTATGGVFSATANAMTFGATTTAGGGSMTLGPRTSGTMIDIGGNDVVSTVSTLGLNGTDSGNLVYGSGSLTIGSAIAGNMSVTSPTSLPGAVSLTTGGALNVTSNLTAGNTLNITANSMSIPGGVEIAAPNGILVTSPVNLVLGTRGTQPGAFELDQAELGKFKITTSGALAFQTSNANTITTTAPLTFTMVPSIGLSAGTITHTGGELKAPGDIVIAANNIPSAGFSPITSTGGGRITIAPNSNRSLNLGTNPAGAALGLVQGQLNQLSTSGVVQLGHPTTTNAVTITAPIAQPAGSNALTIATSGAISQSAGATISASKLKLQSTGAVNLPEANSIGTLAGTSSGTFSLTSAGTVTVATVDGIAGISDGTITMRTDGLVVQSPISGGTVTLAPRLSGSTVNLGGGSGFALTDAAIDLISASTLNIGSNTTGAINVTAPVSRSSGNLNLITGPGGAIDVSAPLSATSNLSFTADAMNITAPISTTSTFGQVTLKPYSAIPVTVGGETTGTLSINTSELGLISARSLGIGSSSSDATIPGSAASGPLTVTAPIGPFVYDTLSLSSSGDVTQTAGSTITVKNTSSSGVVTGSLAVNAGGKIILPETNNVAVSVSGNAGGTGNNFVFNNQNPLKLQDVNLVFASGKVIISSPPGNLVLSPPPTVPVTPPTVPVTLPLDNLTPPQQEAKNTAQSAFLGAVEEAESVQEKSDKAADRRKEEGEKNEAEQDKQEGRKSCG